MFKQHGSYSTAFTKPSMGEVAGAWADICQALIDSYLLSETQPFIFNLIHLLQLSGASANKVEDYIT